MPGDTAATNPNRGKPPRGNCVANLEAKHAAEIRGSRDFIDTKRAAPGKEGAVRGARVYPGGVLAGNACGRPARPPKYERVAVFAMIL